MLVHTRHIGIYTSPATQDDFIPYCYEITLLLLGASVFQLVCTLPAYTRGASVTESHSQVYGTYSLTPDPNGIVGQGLY